MAQHNDFGKKGEELALNYLQKHKYTILERNYRFEKAEVDIIALKGATLAIIEVKARSSNYFGNPQDFVKPNQIKRLIRAVNNYVVENNLDVEVRFDIMAIVKTGKDYNLEHIEDAFYHY